MASMVSRASDDSPLPAYMTPVIIIISMPLIESVSTSVPGGSWICSASASAWRTTANAETRIAAKSQPSMRPNQARFPRSASQRSPSTRNSTVVARLAASGHSRRIRATTREVTGDRRPDGSMELQEMGVVGSPEAPLESQSLVELGGGRVLGAQAEPIEPTARRGQHMLDQPPGDAGSPVVREHVQMGHPADAGRPRVGINVEPTRADQAAFHPGGEQDLAGPVESIRPVRPLVGEPAHEPVSGALALGDHGVEEIRRRLCEALDLDAARAQTHTPSTAVRSLCASPVLRVPAGSMSIIRHSPVADGLCSTPLGTTNISPARSATSPSRR